MKRLLLVDSNPQRGKGAVKKLEAKLKMPVVWTKTLSETDQLLSSEEDASYFAAILDLVLPDAPNGEIIDRVAKNHIPVIVFTASVSSAIRKFIWSKKVVDYVVTDDPSCIDYLVQILNKLIANRKTKILLVDDSSFFRKILSELLDIHRYKIIATTQGEEALRALEQHPDIKLVITDYYMPGMNGYDLCQKIRETHKKEDLAIIGISSEGNSEMAARFIKSGANDFIVKQSFIMEEFYCRVTQCIENIDLIQMTKETAIKDFLTNLYNRRYFFDQGKQSFITSRSKRHPMACAMLDIDHFKQVNDTHGHDTGDRVLQYLSTILLDFVDTWAEGMVARLGGEEFCILVQLKDKNANIEAAVIKGFNDLREKIQAGGIQLNTKRPLLKITMSMGISFNSHTTFDQMVKAADEQLYKAKKNGRNQVVLAKR